MSPLFVPLPLSWLLRSAAHTRPVRFPSLLAPSHCLCPTLSRLEQGPASLIKSYLWFNLPPPATCPCLRSYPVTHSKPASSTSTSITTNRDRSVVSRLDSTTRLDSIRTDSILTNRRGLAISSRSTHAFPLVACLRVRLLQRPASLGRTVILSLSPKDTPGTDPPLRTRRFTLERLILTCPPGFK